MQKYSDNFEDHNYKLDQGIDLIDLFSVLWKKKVYIIIFSSIVSISSIFYALSIPNVYISKAVVAPTQNSEGNISGLASQYSSIASIAGISLPTSKSDKLSMGIEVMQSFIFFENFINKYDYLYKLQAVNSWDKNNNILIANPKVYDEDLKKWISTNEFTIDGKPTIQKAHRDFLKNFTVSQDKKTGFVTLSISHYSPYVAKELLDSLILELNLISKNEAIKMAEDSISFLTQALTSTQLNDIREGINNVIIKQIEIITFANSNPEYLIKNLSPPIAPELKSEPKRSIIVIMISILGGLIICIYFLISHFVTLYKK